MKFNCLRLLLIFPAFLSAQTPISTLATAESEVAQARSSSADTPPAASVLRLVKFSGALKDLLGNPRKGVVSLAFALYKDQQGGPSLWLEVQNAELDEQGRYTVLLGSTRSDGLPVELFSSGEARWLGVQGNLPGEEEQPRVLLVSVPYALKAADAETLGGKPPSAFLLAETQVAKPDVPKETITETPDRVFTHATAGRIAKFTDDHNVGNTATPIVESGTNNIGIGTTDPIFRLDTRANLRGVGANYSTAAMDASSILFVKGEENELPKASTLTLEQFNSRGSISVGYTSTFAGFMAFGVCDGTAPPGQLFCNTRERMRITPPGNVGIGTTTPAEKLEVMGNLKVSGTGNGIIFPDGSTQTSACGTLFSRPLLTSLGSFFQSGASQGLPQFAQAASCGDVSEVFMQLTSKLEEQRADLVRLQAEMDGLKKQLERLLSQTPK